MVVTKTKRLLVSSTMPSRTRAAGAPLRRSAGVSASAWHHCRGMHDTEMTPKPPWKERKVQYLAHLREASAEVRLVSAADKVHNARAILADYRDLGEALW